MAVFFAFPVFMAPVVVLKGILLFKRNITHDKEVSRPWDGSQHAHGPLSLCPYLENG